MAFVVVHMVVPMILFELFYKLRGRQVAMLAVFAAGLGGILPDFDFALGFLAKEAGITSRLLQHGGITHTPLFALLFAAAGLALLAARKKEWAIFPFALAFGVFLHLILDAFIGGGAQFGLYLAYPFSTRIFTVPHLPPNLLLLEMIDGVAMLLWLSYMTVRGNITRMI